jgi:hypothetical protein
MQAEYPSLYRVARKSLTTAEQNAAHNTDPALTIDLSNIVAHYELFYSKRVALLQSLSNEILASLENAASVLLHESPTWLYLATLLPGDSGYPLILEDALYEEREARRVYLHHVFSL